MILIGQVLPHVGPTCTVQYNQYIQYSMYVNLIFIKLYKKFIGLINLYKTAI